MVEVEIQNFQSIEKATFQIDGFTVVVGRSNIGKSALVRAIKAALTGASAASFVRHGTSCLRRTKQAKTCKCYASVHLRSTDFDLLWEKGDAINRYTFNGTVYDKAERGTPPFLNQGFGSVQVGGVGQLLQVADQFTPIFLLDQSGGTVADVLSDVARLDRINAAMRLAEKDRKDKSATRKVRERDVQTLGERLQQYEGLDSALADAKALEAKQTAIHTKEKAVQTIDSYMADLSANVSAVRDLTRAVSVEIPSLSDIKDVHAKLKTVTTHLTDLADKEAAVALYAGVEDIQIPSPKAYKDSLQRLTDLSGYLAKAVELKGWISPWKAVEESPTPHDKDLLAYRDLLTVLDGSLQKYETLEQTVTTLEANLSQTLEEVRKLEEEQRELGVCPTCIRPISECQE